MKQELTPRQKQVLRFIRERIVAQSLAPTIREIAARFGFSSTGTVRDYLHALQSKGYSSLQGAKARAIALTDPGIPIIGRVMAGPGMVAYEDIEGYVRPHTLGLDREDVFALRVKGESMTGKGILDGDVVIVRKSQKARDRQIVVALLGEDATVKEFRSPADRRGVSGRPLLVPANKDYQPIPCDESTRIVGIVERVIRFYV